MTAPLSRLAEDEPGESQADRAGESGRSTPRPAQVAPDFRHDVRFYGVGDLNGHTSISARCKPCRWSTGLDDHDLADLLKLFAQHAGLEEAKSLCIDTLAKLGAADLEPRPIVIPVPLGTLPAAPGAVCRKCGATSNLHQLVNPVSGEMETYCELVGPCYDRHEAAKTAMPS